MGQTAHKLDIREANERRILMAAEREFGRHGYRGATTSNIALEAGLPKANVHYYFRTKARLYRCVLESILEDWMAAAEAFDRHREPAEALASYVGAKMDFSRRRPHGSRVWAKEVMSGAPVINRFLGTTLKQWLDQRETVIQQWVDDGVIRQVNPRALLYMIWATTQHYADFEEQIAILNNNRPLSDRSFKARTRQVIALVLASVGLDH